MKWVTRELVHFDRVASPWLIRRFIDEAATFFFVPWGREHERTADAVPFAIPGVELSDHDANGTTFAKILRKYKLDDPALWAISELIAQVVDRVLHEAKPPSASPVADGVLAIVEGIMMSSVSDADAIERALPVFDGLYAHFRAQQLLCARGEEKAPQGVGATMWLTLFATGITLYVRSLGTVLDGKVSADFGAEFERKLAAIRPAKRSIEEGTAQ